MKAILLAAGQGTRLKPLTDHQPKCMVPFFNKPIINHLIETFCGCGFNEKDIIVITGYEAAKLKSHLKKFPFTYYHNQKFDRTNMVTTLFEAQKEFNDDIIICYTDIIFDPQILQKLINSADPAAITIDKQWKSLWQLRMANPLDDAESLILDSNNYVLELGKVTDSYQNIHGQYMGLIKFSKEIAEKVIPFYHSLDKNILYDGKDFNNMYMTSLLQLMIDGLTKIKAVPIDNDGGWVEIDSTEDLRTYEANNKIQKLFAR